MIKVHLTRKGLDALSDLPRCIDRRRHGFFCPHRGRMHELNWVTRDGCSGTCCMSCYYAVGGPAYWTDLSVVRAIHQRKINAL